MATDGKYDGVFYTIVQSSGGQGYDSLFDEVFSWLRRKTDFFTDKEKAEKVIAQAGEKHAIGFQTDKVSKEKEDVERKAREDERKKQVADADKKRKEKEDELKSNPPPIVEKKEEETKEGEEKKEEEDKTPAPKGNGGQTDRYAWTQTLEEAKVTITLDNGNLRGKDFNVVLTSTHCTVGIKGQPAIISNSQWYEQINAEDSNWILEPTPEGGKVLSINIQKWGDRNGWWDCAFKGDDKINTQKIQPETSKVSDLDGEMKGTVEKMMFDMKQKQMGLPSSDDMQKQDKIKDFMKAHPEMDFSKAKIC